MNVLLYVFDALRADYIGKYGHEGDITPTLDMLAEDGVVFEQCITPSTWTRPVAASILTGLYPVAHGTRDRLSSYEPPIQSLPEAFEETGYRTGAIGSMPNIRAEFGFDRGFDHFNDVYTDPRIQEKNEELRPGVPRVRAEELNGALFEWLDESNPNDPFFALCWSFETHAPYDPPPEYRNHVDPEYDGPVDGSPESFSEVSTEADRDHLRGLYKGCVRYNDDCLENLIQGLRARGLYEDTVVVCIGDHGDGHGEHPGFYGHGITPYEELIHVPCIVRTPNDVQDHRIPAVTSLLDLYPTLVNVCNLDITRDAQTAIQGESQASVLKGGDVTFQDRCVFVDGNRPNARTSYHVARTDRWKLIDVVNAAQATSPSNLLKLARNAVTSGKLLDILRHPSFYWNRNMDTTDGMMFDLEADPEEMTNRYGDGVGPVEELEEALQEWRSECSRLADRFESDPDAISIDSDSKDRLQALGYLQED